MPSVVSVAVYAGPFPSYTLTRALEDALLDTAIEMQGDYEDITDAWETPIEFDVDLEIGDDYEVMVYSLDPVFNWVNEGTGQAAGNRSDWYPIEAVNAPEIVYQPEFEAKTRPGSLKSNASGGKSGPYKKFGDVVYHPGITPRNFDLQMERKYGPLLARRLDRILMDYARSARRVF